MKTNSTRMLAGCLLAAGLITPCLQSQNLAFTTIAGGSQGSADGLNANASFYTPTGVAVDGSGDLFVADQNNNSIRQISPRGTNWIVTTIAGGVLGNLDGSNTSARFSSPTGIALDSMTNLYVADQFNHTLRKITPLGTNWVVSTIAGQPGVFGTNDGSNAGARFHNPIGVAVDGANNIFVADEFDNAIRKITPAGTNWIVTTIAGGASGTTPFFDPAGVAVDANGRVFVADQFNNAIGLITPVGANWVVTTIAGQSTAGFANGLGSNALFDAPVGVAVDANEHVYVADLFNEAIRELAPSGTNWEISTPGGGSQGSNNGTGANASFNLPFGVAVDAYGDVFVADSENNSIRMGIATNSPAATGSLDVMISPSNAISAGARWQLDGGPSLLTNGTILSGLVPGDHAITFGAISGYTTPAPQTVVVTAHQTTTATANYALVIANAGSLQVMISPSGAADAGAYWQLDGGAIQNSGMTMTNLAVGNHTVSFTPIFKWNTPASQTVTITNSTAMSAVGVYTAFATPSDGLTLLTNGSGTIQHAHWPAALVIGAKYTVTAVPKRGNVFSNWAGGTNLPYPLQRSSSGYTFTMQSNMVLEANFVTNVFQAAQGTYRGLFGPTTPPRQQPASGSFLFNVSSSGTVSGSLALAGQVATLSGKFNLGGAAVIVSKLPRGAPSLTTTLQLDFTNQSVSGSVSNEAFTAELQGDRNVFNASRPAAEFEGQYTLIIPGTNDPASGPFGDSYGTVKVTSTGTITLAGSLADGTAISQSSAVSKDGYWPLYITLYGGKGSLWGWGYFTNHTLAAAPALSWINETNSAKKAMYRPGFTNQQAALIGGLYTSAFALPADLTATLAGGNLPFAIMDTNLAENTNHLVFKTNNKTGVISGSFANPSEPNQTVKISGVVLPGQTNAEGYFLGTNQSGAFTLGPPAE